MPIRNDSPVGFPEIAEDDALLVSIRNAAPELFTRRNAAPAYNTGDDLPGVFTNC